MAISPFTGSLGSKPLTQITPFTYRDGLTFLQILSEFEKWLSNLNIELDTKLLEYLTNVEGIKSEWSKLFDEFIADVINRLEGLNDQAVANLIQNATSKIYNALIKEFPTLEKFDDLKEKTVTKNSLFVSVLDHGAEGDGITDDTAAIQMAFDVAAATGKVVKFPSRSFKISDWLRANAGQVIDARGARINLRVAGTSGDIGLLVTGKSDDKFYGYSGNGEITVIGGTWDAGGHVNEISYSNGFAVGHVNNFSMENVTIMNISRGHALDLAGCRNVSIDSCKFLGYTDRGNPRGTEAIQLDITSGSGFPHYGANDNTPCTNVVITACTFDKSDDAGMWPRAVGSHGAKTDRQMTNITISGCTGNVTENAIRAYNWTDFTITGNSFHGGSIYVLSIDDSKNSSETMNGNDVQTGQSAPLYKGIITGNKVSGAPQIGIWLAGRETGKISECVISDNTVSLASGSDGYGIALHHSNDVAVSGNVIMDTGKDGIQVQNGDDNVIAGNRIKRAGNHGINMLATYRTSVEGNNIHSSKGHGISFSSKGWDNMICNNIVANPGQGGSDNVGIRVNSINRSTISSNIVRSSDGKMTVAVSAADSAVDIFISGNDLRGIGSATPIADVGSGTIKQGNIPV